MPLRATDIDENGDVATMDDAPSVEQMTEWVYDGVAEATDGCSTEHVRARRALLAARAGDDLT